MYEQVMNQSQIVAIIISNVILVLGAVWRLSASLQKVETQLVGMNDKMEITNKYHDQELTNLKTQVASLFEGLRDAQTRLTAIELENRIMKQQ